MILVEQRDKVVPLRAACDALEVSRASLYRARRPRAPSQNVRQRARNPRRLDEVERQRLLDTMHLPEFADQPPTEVYASLLGRGIYLASIRTMYRVLAAVGETGERRNQRAPHAYTKPSLTATAPNQIWTWDITKLATMQKGVFLMAYVIIDLFSRYVVGWMVAPKECKHLAARLFAETIARHGIEPGLQVHMDRGSAMKSDTLAQLLASLGASRSFSRPHVSDDNAFSEAQFKTMKYQPDYPGRFVGELHGRGWLQDFFGWHNDEHHHSGLALFTPPPTSSSDAWLASPPCAKLRSTPPTPHTPSGSLTARQASRSRPLRSTSIRSPTTRSRSSPRPRRPHDAPTPTSAMSNRSPTLAALRRPPLGPAITT